MRCAFPLFCHTISLPIHWSPNEASLQGEELLTLFQARLLFLHVDVLCIFSGDFHGLSGIRAQLSAWAAAGSTSTLSQRTRLRLVLIVQVDSESFEKEDFHYRSEILALLGFWSCFSCLKIFNIMGTTRQLLAPIKKVLDQELQHARTRRLEIRTQFSAIHLAAFFEGALRKFVGAPRRHFNFIMCTRRQIPINPEFKLHLRAFTLLCLDCRIPQAIVSSFVASAVLLDSYPPGMHR